MHRNSWSRMTVIVLSALVALVALCILATALGRWRFERMVEREVAALYDGAAPEAPPIPLAEAIADLPPPVQRYLRFALPDPAPRPTAARIHHGGLFRLAPDKDFWPIQGEQYYTVRRPGFVWHARIRLAPLTWFEVRDFYRQGQGGIWGKLWSLFTVVRSEGSPEIAQGALLRWLGEAAWLPQAWLDREQLQWEPIDDEQARVTLTDSEVRVSGVLTVNAQGQLIHFDSPDRPMEVDGKLVPTPWRATFTDYRQVQGVRIPFTGAVAWELQEGPFEYARFTLEHVDYGIPTRLE
jgi:hypothetical protein